MEKINAFQITGMTLSGFKSYSEPTQLTFGNPTLITGGNGRGKSSIADAIAFAITGLPFFGERGIDRLHSDDNPDLFVSLRFTDDMGKPHELSRSRQKSRMTITYDGYETRQHILADLFGEKDVFLSILNPLYFIEELGDEGSNLLERYLPAISHEAVLEQLSEATRKALAEEPLLSPETYLKRRREEIRTLEEGIIYLSGQKDLLENQNAENAVTLEQLTDRRTAVTNELEVLQFNQFEGMDIPALKEQLADLYVRYDEMAQDTGGDDAVTALRLKLQKREMEQYGSKFAQPLADAEAELKMLGQRHAKETALLGAMRPGMTCPTCFRTITKENLADVTQELKGSIAAILTEGKEKKGQLAQLRALDQKSKETFEQFKAEDIAKYTQALAELTVNTSGADRHSDVEALHTQIQTLSADLEYGTLTEDEHQQLKALSDERDTIDAQLTALQAISDKAMPDLDGQMQQAKSKITEGKKRIADVVLYISKRAELTFAQLAMNRVQISLFDVVKTTGEVKNTFKFTYDGRLYNRLSLSEKIRAGMEVSELVKRLTGRNYPVFVDNMESVEELNNVRPTGQIIMAKYMRGAELSVRGTNHGETAQKAAA